MTDNWIELTESTMPQPNRLMWVKRKSGNLYLASRRDKPLATNKDASRDCYWYGNPFEGFIETDNGDFKSQRHFSDVTVTHYQPLKSPTE